MTGDPGTTGIRAGDTLSRRGLLRAAGGVTGAAVAVAAGGGTASAAPASAPRPASFVEVAPGVEVFVHDLDGGSRGTILFVPGFPLPGDAWEYQLLFFAEQGYRALALDQRGFGRSSAPFGAMSYDVWAADIEAVLRSLRIDRAALVGHSMGGAIALHHAARFGDRLSHLVLAAPAAPKYVSGPRAADIAAALEGLITGFATDRPATVAGIAAGFFDTHTDPVTDPLLQQFVRQGVDLASPQGSRAALTQLRDVDLTPDLARVRTPTLVLWGADDKLVPLDHVQTVAAGIRNAGLVQFRHSGHGLYVDETDRFNQTVLSFITS
jgi:pimeloyl-ACP methyl ester carboxylesterase